MTKKYISFILGVVIIVLPIVEIFGLSKASASSSVVQYLKSVDPQTDWTIMARIAVGDKINDVSFLQEFDGSNANDYATYILAITALGEDPRSFGDKNLIYGLRQLSQNGQIGDEDYLNDDIFSLIALKAAGVPNTDSLVVQEIKYIKNKQTIDGGWNWNTESNEAMVDYTAMGIMALLSAGVDINDTFIARAIDYLLSAQNNDGGFGMYVSDKSNTVSTSWVLSAIYAMNDDINFWIPLNDSPIDYLNARLNTNGYFLFDSTSTDMDQFTSIATSYAAIALAGKYYPLSSILKPATVSLRIEGQEDTLCILDNAQGRTALDVIKSSSDECGYNYIIEDTQYGLYLSEIAGESASGVNGWLYLPNYEMPQVGAEDYIMSESDELIWYYGAWDDKPLRITNTKTFVNVGDFTTAFVEQYSEGSWSAFSGATVIRGTESFVSDAQGKVELSWPFDGSYYLYAKSEKNVRTKKIFVVVGNANKSQSIGMNVNIEQNNNLVDVLNTDYSSDIVFSVSGDLSFGTLQPGQSSTNQAIITNNSSVAIRTTATIEGSSLFINNITLDNVIVNEWHQVVETNASKSVDVTLSVPQLYSGIGQEQGTLIFWANAVN